MHALEEEPGFETCDYEPSLARVVAELTPELGSVVDGAFVPLPESGEVEVVPAPREEIAGDWFATVAVRFKGAPDTLTEGCLRTGRWESDDDDAPEQGYPVRRLANGDLVAPVVPLPVTLPVNAVLDFFGSLGQPQRLLVTGAFSSPAGPAIVQDLQVVLRPVNETGFLSERRPDAGTADPGDAGTVTEPANFSAFLLVRRPRLKPGESSEVELSVVGSRGDKYVEFAKQHLPGTMLLLDRNGLEPELDEEAARVTTGTFSVLGDAVPGDYTLEVTVQAFDGSYATTASYAVTVLPP